MPQLRSKFQVSTFSRFKVIAFFIFVYEFVKYAGKNIRTSDAKHRGSPNEARQKVFVAKHLSQKFHEQKMNLMPKFKEAREAGDRIRWGVSNGSYCLFINDNKLRS